MSGGKFLFLEEDNDEYTSFVLEGYEAIEVIPAIGITRPPRVIYVDKHFLLKLQKLKLISKSKAVIPIDFKQFFRILELFRELKQIPKQLKPLIEKITQAKPKKIEAEWKLDIQTLTELLRLHLKNQKLEKTIKVKELGKLLE